MKCPQCEKKQKRSAGMTCSCGYVFALDPKERPYLSDRAVRNTIEKLSPGGQYYFTFNQLYVAIYKLLAKKRKKKAVTGTIVGAIVAIVILALACLNPIEDLFGPRVAWFLLVVGAAAIVVGAVKHIRRPTEVPHEDVTKAINQYKSMHPISELVDGTRFKSTASKDQMRQELFDYAPERILIVPTNDMVDMLALNRFHFDNKTAVISASKYPDQVFHACQRFLDKHSDIPVEIIHDVSKPGLSLKDKLLADKSWNLEGKNVKDLGLFPSDVARMKNPIWLPGGSPGSAFHKSPADNPAQEKIDQGMRMPVDFVAPKVMLGALGLAVLGGLLLMSDELLAEERRRAMTGEEGYGSGGFG